MSRLSFYEVRSLLSQGKSIVDIPLRVTFYARVSTDSLDQLNSLENQISYFENYIKSNKQWEYVPGYIDEGISGSSVKNRHNFLRMIKDAKNKKFDLIITKEVSRFSRSLSDSIKYTQELMNNDVGVFFQTNGINTYDVNSEFILNMMGSVAQEEVKRLSLRIKWGQQNAIRRGRVLGSSKILGYTKDKASLKIDLEESKVVREIFNLYATGKYGLNKLGLVLAKKNILNSKGNIYDKATLRHIISNPKYKGYYCGHTTEISDYRSKRRIKIPLSEQIIYRDENIPAIVSEELWERANAILKERSSNLTGKKAHKYPYSGLIICSEHLAAYNRLKGTKRSTTVKWACSEYVKYHLSVCKSPLISEVDLNYIFNSLFDELFKDKESLTQELTKYYDISLKYEENIKSIREQLAKLLDLRLKDIIDDDEFLSKKDDLTKELEEYLSLSQNTSNIIPIIKELLDNKNIDAYVRHFIKRIMVSKIDDSRTNLKLQIQFKEYFVWSYERVFYSHDSYSKSKNCYHVFFDSCSN